MGQLIGTAIAMIDPAPAGARGVHRASPTSAMIAFGVTLLVSFVVLFRLVFGGDD